MTFKKLAGKVHLWLGLFSGLVVFIVGLTGCILVFEEEICRLLDYGVFRKAERSASSFAPPSKIFPVADSVLQHKRIARTYYTTYLSGSRVNALWALDSIRRYHAVLQNPYSGEVVGSYDYETAFFAIVTRIHISLGMGEPGRSVVSYATLVFVILMITGIILWKPASRKGYRQRFTIKWDAKARRLNYDLHNVPGFYMTWVAIFIAITGLVWSFEWMNQSVQWIANGGKTAGAQRHKAVSDTSALRAFENTGAGYRIADRLFHTLASDREKVKAVRVYKPSSLSDALRFTVETHKGASYVSSDDYYYDQYTGELLSAQPFADLDNGEKIRRMNYYIHVGSIGGLTGKFMAFFASLIATSLPVTGFIIWRGRKKPNSPAGRKGAKPVKQR